MQSAGIKPNHTTYVRILSARCHVGLIENFCYYFDSMALDHGIYTREEHYSCMDCAGQLVDAEFFMNKMQFEPGPLVWQVLLSACISPW